MKISEKTKNSLRLAMNSIFILALISLMMACGSGGGGGSTSGISGGATDRGSSISGRVALSGASTGRALYAVSGSDTAYTAARVQMVAADGNVVYVTTTDEDGKFEFDNVPEGDYTVVVIDEETGETVTQVDVTVIQGDDVEIEGVVNMSKTEWTIDFKSNDEDSSDLLENDEQMEKAEKLAKASGLTLDEVIDMRLSGMGWGKIAKELGVHPSILGHSGEDKDEGKDEDKDHDGEDKDEGKDDDKGKDKDHDGKDKDEGKDDDKGKDKDHDGKDKDDD